MVKKVQETHCEAEVESDKFIQNSDRLYLNLWMHVITSIRQGTQWRERFYYCKSSKEAERFNFYEERRQRSSYFATSSNNFSRK